MIACGLVCSLHATHYYYDPNRVNCECATCRYVSNLTHAKSIQKDKMNQTCVLNEIRNEYYD